VKIPVGECTGQDVTEVTVAQLEEACDKVDADLCSMARSNTHRARKLKTFVGAARPLLKQRKFPTGTYSNSTEANRALRDAVEVGWLVAPSDQLARVVDGTAIILSAMRVDPMLDSFQDDDDPKYRVPGKSMLDRIANLLGLSWDPDHCRRTDNQTQPFVRSCQAACRVRNFDGSWRPLQAHAEIDLRDGSSLQTKIVTRITDRVKARIELERRRQHILAHTDTSARLRVIRQLGLLDRYLPTELSKPFFVARVQFTGETDNPESRQVFAQSIAGAFLPSVDAVFGEQKKAASQ
jgi:hypothetical protein